MRFLLRLIGLIALAGAFTAIVIDGARSIANSQVELTPLGAALAALAPGAFAALPAAIGRIHPKLWDPLLIDALYIPTSLALLVIGIVSSALASRNPRRG